MSDLPTGTRQLIDSARAVSDSYLYTAYGEPVASTGADRNPFQYGGQVGYYTGPGAGIVLCGARWYNPWTARWMTRDPIGYAGGENLYGYCGENPVVGLDPGGLDCGGGGYWLGVESAPPPGGDGLSLWDLLPVIGSGRDIFYGIENGNPLRFGLGIVGMAFDIASLGGDFAEKGAAEVGVKEAIEGGASHLVENKGFGELSHAAEYGIRPYGELQKALKGAGLQAHHISEQRFAHALGDLNVRQMSAIAVTRGEHQAFTNAWRSAIHYGSGTAGADAAQVIEKGNGIYREYPALLPEVGK